MLIVEPSVKLLAVTRLAGEGWDFSDPCSEPARAIERAGRTCWKSEGKMSEGSAKPFCDRVIGQFGHASIAEHASATVLFVTDRIVSHQLVRHRIAAYSQESSHYLNYSKGAFDRQIRVCKPWDLGVGSLAFEVWKEAMEHAEAAYFELIEKHSLKHYEARYVLPMCLKTELVATWNFRMWDHVLAQRTAVDKATGKMKNTPETHYLLIQAGKLLAGICPEIFSKYL